MVSTSSSETAPFYHDRRFPLSHQFSLPLPVLGVTTQEDIWLFSVSYQSPRLCLRGYTQAHLPEHFGKLLQYPRNYLRNTPSPWATRWKAGPYRSLQSSMRSVPASSRLTSCHPPPTSTPASVLQSPGSLKTPYFFLPQDLCTCSFLCPKGSFSILLLSFI